jgi:hypothetical protein
MKIKASVLIDLALDWAVAKADQPVYSDRALIMAVLGGVDGIGIHREPFRPSTNPAQGAHFIDREGIQFRERAGRGYAAFRPGDAPPFMEGPDKLIAGMRCYVNAELGAEIEVPDELLLDDGLLAENCSDGVERTGHERVRG